MQGPRFSGKCPPVLCPPSTCPTLFSGIVHRLVILRSHHAKTYFLGIDVSTTGSKALLIDENGAWLPRPPPRTHSRPRGRSGPSRTRTNGGGLSSSAIRSVLQQAGLGGESVAAVGLTGQMHGLVLLDENGRVLRPAILWNDQRTQPQCDEIHRRIGRERFIQITGNVALTGFTAPKILWVQQNEPEIYAKARHVLLPKDYVRYQLTGEYAMDKADGSGTVLFDLKAAQLVGRRFWPRWASRLTGCRPPSKARSSPARSAPKAAGRPA